MRLLMTGAAGFLGKHLICRFAAMAHTGCAVSRNPGGPLPIGWEWAAREIVLRRATAIGCEWVVHLEVKQHTPHPTPRDFAEFRLVNVDGTAAWLDWCARNGVNQFMYLSTIKSVRPLPNGSTDESAEGPPSTPYGASKWEAEQLVRRWVAADSRRTALIIRPAVIYGSGNQGNIAAMASAIRGRRFFLVGRNENRKSIVAVDNATAAICHLLDKARPGNCAVFNLVDADTYSVREIDRLIRQWHGLTGNSPTIPVSLARLGAWAGDLTSLFVRRPFPINSAILSALLENSDFSCDKLLATGFVHPVKTLTGL